MEQIKFKVNCKRLDGSSQIAEVTLSETNEITYVNSETPSPYVGFKVEVVSTLPDTGENGVIYLVPGTGTAPNIYDEYVWVEGNNAFECLGTTEISLEGTFNVIKASEIINNTLTDEQYAEITNGKPTLIEGTISGKSDILCLPGWASNAVYGSKCFYVDKANYVYIEASFSLNISTKVLSFNNPNFAYTSTGGLNINGKTIPTYPSSPASDQTLVYKTDNTLAWEDKPEAGKKLYLHDVAWRGKGGTGLDMNIFLHYMIINESSEKIDTLTKLRAFVDNCCVSISTTYNSATVSSTYVLWFKTINNNGYTQLLLYDNSTGTTTFKDSTTLSSLCNFFYDTVTEL